MSRRSESTKHPAIMARPVDDGVGDPERIPNWDKLTDKDRTYLAAYVRCGDGVKALEMAHVSTGWLDQRRRRLEFKVALKAVSVEPLRFVGQFIEGQIGWSLVRLGELLDSANEDVRLRAIKQFHDIAGIKKERDSGIPQGFVNVNVFGAPSSASQERVDVVDVGSQVLAD